MTIEYLEPWEALETTAHFADELKSELCRGHPLFEIPVRAIARRGDCDDFLFLLLDGTHRVAVVHLSWKHETDPTWPRTSLYTDIQDWGERCMGPEHKEWMELIGEE